MTDHVRLPAVGDVVMLWGRVREVWPEGEVVEVELVHRAVPDAVLFDLNEFERVGEIRDGEVNGG